MSHFVSFFTKFNVHRKFAKIMNITYQNVIICMPMVYLKFEIKFQVETETIDKVSCRK